MATKEKKAKSAKKNTKQLLPGKGKRTSAIQNSIDSTATHSIAEAVKEVKKYANAKFDETIEIAVRLGIDPRHSDQIVRGIVEMPNGIGKTVRVAVFVKEDREAEAKKAGADLVGSEALIEEINKGKIDFDRCIATPDMMATVSKVARVLGPRGLMPNPKLGTVTNDVAEAIKKVKSGQIEFKAEKTGIVHAGLGKASFGQKELVENVDAFMKAIDQAKPSGAKGIYIEGVSLSSTMGPGIKLDTSSLKAA